MTVLPLYWIMWHDLPTSFPPPRHKNMSSSAGSTGSSTSGESVDSFLLAVILQKQPLAQIVFLLFRTQVENI